MKGYKAGQYYNIYRYLNKILPELKKLNDIDIDSFVSIEGRQEY